MPRPGMGFGNWAGKQRTGLNLLAKGSLVTRFPDPTLGGLRERTLRGPRKTDITRQR